MNGTYFKNPSFSENQETNMNNAHMIDDLKNILKINIGKKVKIHSTIPESNEWRDKIFSGIIEEANDEYLILSDPTTGNWFLIFKKNIAYVEFEEKLII